ncbi:hypothetical protein BURMUCGD1_5345 [Burkholderia multivorans CGD1]|nr:hypothetical protein BURMUCGD1_5345 [Burkholderia multivorans CGD1]
MQRRGGSGHRHVSWIESIAARTRCAARGIVAPRERDASVCPIHRSSRAKTASIIGKPSRYVRYRLPPCTPTYVHTHRLHSTQ